MSAQLPGIEWFTGRDELEKRRPLDQVLNNHERIDTFTLTGARMASCVVGALRAVRRVILPDPASPDVKRLAAHLPEGKDLPDNITSSSRLLLRGHKVHVRWYPSLLFHSMLIVDSEKNSGFFHDELVLPFTKPTERPSVRFYRREFEDVVVAAQAAFDRMWDESRSPADSDLM
ncbi:MAG: hypothetical protein EXQ86_00980 [Rhodospirillales bacterium]|nr:hypothetical protein [Rhodospirillales bacterium]